VSRTSTGKTSLISPPWNAVGLRGPTRWRTVADLRYNKPVLDRNVVVFGVTLGLSVAVVTLAGAVDRPSPPHMFAPVSTPAFMIRELAFFVMGIAAAIFVVVAGLTVFAIVRFRRRPGQADREPPQVYGSTRIELAWTVVPLLIVVVLFLVTTRYIWGIERRTPPPGALEVTVVGHQWWWEIRYPELGIVTANELHVPVASVPTFITLESADVIHSFWVPQLSGKMDVIPGRVNRVWIEPLAAGVYLGQCAEYCGLEHALMLLRVVVHPREAFDRWVADQQAPARDDPAGRRGRDLFASLACINCHTIRGTPANGVFGPDLTHLMSRQSIGAGAAANTPDELRAWVDDPSSRKPGALMPAMKLSPAEVDHLVRYLVTLR
jgi:cytochrome c oxidase subunit 2